MLSNKELGNTGENIAKKYLENHKYIILERNYRCKLGEIDLIAKKGNTVVFIEVKTRRNTAFGEPEESINSSKINKIRKSANYYINSKKFENFEVSFDVISLKLIDGKCLLKHIKSAF